ncbi:hypothetical protein GRI34_05435 [Erythrobacter aquimaris]|uniref:Oligosaccharide flippase family protein n=1 Tax=Qipengyuania aquimaris TaxID=255984 RepID=A0A6I4TMU3_9SPHN|nr:hypothetical protein [Qipengyuania aquimaris]MXO95863.1 hypothetical protein [Qipengyuania aquimaris]
MLLMIVSVNSTIGYLGPERFGVWVTLMSFVAMLSFLDLGVGNALTNLTAERATNEDVCHLRQSISSGLLVLIGIALGVALVMMGLSQILPWASVFRLTDPALVREARTGSMVFALGFVAVLFSGGVQKVFLGLQRAAIGHMASMVANMGAILALIIAAEYRVGVPVLLAIMLAGQSIGAIPLIVILWKKNLLSMRAGWRGVRFEAPLVLKTGSLFFVLQVGAMVGWGADLLIVSSTMGAAFAASLAVAQRLFQFAALPIQILTQPLWGAYAEANASGDRAFIRRVLKFSLIGAATLALVLVSILVLAHRPLVERWTDGVIILPISFVVIYGIWSVIEATSSAASVYLNGCYVIKPQIYAVIIFCLCSIPLKIYLSKAFGLHGIVLSTIIAWIISVPLLYWLFFKDEVIKPLKS